MNSGQAKARQSMQSEFMDCHASLAMNSRVIVKVAVIARNVVTWQSACGIGPDSGGSP
jgi:hypothetical protein